MNTSQFQEFNNKEKNIYVKFVEGFSGLFASVSPGTMIINVKCFV